MSAKKFDLAKSLGLKIAGRMGAAGASDRFGAAAAESSDRREQRRRDAAAGLVPFACKLPAELTRELQQLASTHEGGINGLVAELLAQGLKKFPTASADSPADEPDAPKAAKKAPAARATPKEAEAEAPAAKKVAAKKTAAKKA